MKPDRDFADIPQIKNAYLTRTEFAELLSGMMTVIVFLLYVFALFGTQGWSWLPALLAILVMFIAPSLLLMLVTYLHVYKQSRTAFYFMFLFAGYLSFIHLFPFFAAPRETPRHPYSAVANIILTVSTFILAIVNSNVRQQQN